MLYICTTAQIGLYIKSLSALYAVLNIDEDSSMIKILTVIFSDQNFPSGKNKNVTLDLCLGALQNSSELMAVVVCKPFVFL